MVLPDPPNIILVLVILLLVGGSTRCGVKITSDSDMLLKSPKAAGMS